MKKIFLVLFTTCIYLYGCRGQEKKTVTPAVADTINFISFEERQKSALENKKETDLYSAGISGLNFRFAASQATPAVVHVKSVYTIKAGKDVPDFFRDFFDDEFWRRYFPQNDNAPQQQIGSASGVIVSTDGYIVTNNHVVGEADSIEVVLHDQRSYKANVIGTDPATDLALLKIEEKKLSFIVFGNSDSVEVGDIVLAVGNPFNLASTVTAGIVSAKARNINILTDKSAVESYIQTDAAVNRGNSGGALVDVNGKLVGINAAIATPTGAYAGYAFAIPVEIVKKTINDLLQYGKVLRGYLGVIISDMDGEKAKIMGTGTTTGVLVDSLVNNGAAMKAGIQKSDIIIKIDNHIVEKAPQLREIIARHRPGDKLQITVARNGKEKIIAVVLMPEEEKISELKISSEILKKLGIEIENLSNKEKNELKIPGGVKVKNITPGKIAEQTTIRKGFIITRVQGNIVTNSEEFMRELQDKKGGVLLEGIYPGTPGVFYYAIGL